MNKLFTKLGIAFAGIAMAIGVGVGISHHNETSRAEAADTTDNLNSTTMPSVKSDTTSWHDTTYTGAGSGLTYNLHYMGGNNNSDGRLFAWNANGYLYVSGTASQELKSVTITTAANTKSIGIYAANSAYSGSPSGSALTTLSATTSGATYTFTSSYKYLGLKGTASSTFIKSIVVVYKDSGGYSYSITYDGNGKTGGTVPSNQSGTDTSVTLSDNILTLAGYRHIGWSTSSHLSDDSPEYELGESVTLTGTLNITLYAHWKQTFTVTYNGNGSTGGSVPTDSNSPYLTGSTVTVLGNTGNLVKTGNDFLGWKIGNAGDLLNPGDEFTISSNVTLYAQWGVNPYTSVYSTGFESSEGFTADTTYNSTKTQGPSGKQWTFYYGTPSTNDALVGSQSGQCRWYSNTPSNIPYMKTNFATSKVKKISFTYKVSNIDLDFKTQYSTDGSTWTDIETIDTDSTSATDYSKVLSSTINTFYLRILVCGTEPSTGNYKFIVDSVNFYQETNTDPKVTIDGNETSMSITEEEEKDVVKTLTLENVTMADLSYNYNDQKVDLDVDNPNSQITITGLVVGGPYDIEIKKNTTVLFTIYFTVISNNVVTVTSAGGATSLKTGATLLLSATSSKGEDTFTWSSSSDSIATVTSAGLVTGVAEGSVTITATSNTYAGTSGTKELTVTFGADNSVGNFYDASTLSETGGSAATIDGIKSAFSGSSSIIDSVSKGTYQQTGKFGGLSLGSGGNPGSISVTMKDAYKLKSISIWCAKVDDSVTTPTVTYGTGNSADTAATQLSNGATIFSKGEALNENAVPFTYTFASLAKTVEFSATKSTKWTIYKVVLCWTTVEADELSFDVGSSFALMNTITKTLHVKASPLYYNVELGSLTWNSTNTDVATVTSAGVVEAKANSGTSVITATASGLTATATMNAISKVASSVTIDSSIVATGSTSEINGVTWRFSAASRYGNDYMDGKTLIAYTRGSIQLKTGYIQNDTAAYFKIKKVIVALCLAADGTSAYDQTLTVAGSNTSAGGSDVSSTNSTTGLLKTYTLAEGCDYVKISSSSTVDINSVTIEYITPEETIYSVADFILGLQPDRGGESIGSCTLPNGTYKAAKTRMALLDETARGNFQTSQDLTVAAARERYEIWARNNNDAHPYDGTTTITNAKVLLFNTIFNSSNNVIIIAIVSVITTAAIGGYFFLRKRKED